MIVHLLCCKKDGYSLSCMKENDLDILMLVQVPGLPVPTVCLVPTGTYLC